MSEAVAVFILLTITGLVIFALLSRAIHELRGDLAGAERRIASIADDERRNYWRTYHKLQALYEHMGVEFVEEPARTSVRKQSSGSGSE